MGGGQASHWFSLVVTCSRLCSEILTSSHLVSLDLDCSHLFSLVLICSRLISLVLTCSHLFLTCSHLPSQVLACSHHLFSLVLTCSRLVLTCSHVFTLFLTCSDLFSLVLTCSHLFSLGLTWSHLDSLGFLWTHLLSRRERERIPGKEELGREGYLEFDLIPTRHPERVHARMHAPNDTKRFPGWTHLPPTSDLNKSSVSGKMKLSLRGSLRAASKRQYGKSSFQYPNDDQTRLSNRHVAGMLLSRFSCSLFFNNNICLSV